MQLVSAAGVTRGRIRMSLFAIGDLHLHFGAGLKAPGQLRDPVWRNQYMFWDVKKAALNRQLGGKLFFCRVTMIRKGIARSRGQRDTCSKTRSACAGGRPSAGTGTRNSAFTTASRAGTTASCTAWYPANSSGGRP